MKYVDVLVKQGRETKTEFSQRFVDFLKAGLDQHTIESVNYNVIAYQQKNGTLRTDRMVEPKKEKMKRSYYERRETALMQNESDQQAIDNLAVYKQENSLDMDETADQWFDYITTGTIGLEVKEILAHV